LGISHCEKNGFVELMSNPLFVRGPNQWFIPGYSFNSVQMLE
jgi:hypothetical protein